MAVETQNVEFKQKVSNFRDISATACAFANASGGKIIVGLANDGKVVGVLHNELDSLQQRIEGAIQQISPVPFHKIFIEEKEGKNTVVAEVYQVGQGSFCTFGGIVYFRAGSLNSKLEGRTLQDYLVTRHILSFDEIRSNAKLGDLDAEKMREFLKTRSPDVKFEDGKLSDFLQNLGLAQKNGDLWIKNAAILFFAKEPPKFLPQDEVKLVRFKGTTPVDIIDSRLANGTLVLNLKEAEDFIRKNTRTAYKIEKAEREELPEYPVKVTREALVNALTHRDYFSRDAVQINVFDDRIEFINPGTLPAGLSLQILGTLSVQRNPLTYRLMRDLKLVEGFATGIPRMRSAMKEAGLPEPVFEELGSFFRVTLYNKQVVAHGVASERQKKALAYLEKNHSISSKVYGRLVGLTHPVAVSDLNDLVAKGLFKKVGKTRGAFYVKSGSLNNT
ncbi:MAG: ATP-binding protein [Candidatus Micrarchaeota archaeon]